MATIELEIAGRRYSVSCRDGEEAHLQEVGAIVDGKAQDAAGALGKLSESRQLLFASLLLADELKEKREADGGAASPVQADPGIADALERLAERMERLAESLEGANANP